MLMMGELEMIKKIFSVVLVAFIVLILSYSAFADNANRYVVLILDTSGSMSGEPATVQKNAAKKFCQQVLNAQGDSHVALVSLNTRASITCQFTNDINELTSRIDTLYASGGTNIYESLQLAGELLDGITATSTVKNIVLCSDGLPEDGEPQDGPYSYRDFFGYEYANAAYNTAKELKDKKYNIYTLGFFHSLYDEYLEFGRRFMQDLSSGNAYYEVTDVEYLEFTFGEIADDVVSDDKTINNPIIIVPGIMGSRLFMSSSEFNEQQKAWDPIVLDSSGKMDYWRTVHEKIGFPDSGLLSRRLDLSSPIYTRPCENQNVDTSDTGNSTVYQYGRECGAHDGTQESYIDLVNYLCQQYASGDKYRAVYFFSYDWRRSNTESAVKLHSCIQDVLNETGAKKVDLVCHSMGGLVASKYYTEYGNEQVDYIITCGTPYEGAPKLIDCVMNWKVLGGGISDFALGFLGWMNKNLKSSWMGVTELLPTENYINRIPMRKALFNPLNWNDYHDLSFSEYQDICRKVFAGYNSAYIFQKSLKDGDYNALLKYDKSYFILGINQPTITAIKYKLINGIDLLEEDDLSYSMKGDGTVPYLSASISEQLNSFSFERVLPYATDHGGVVKEAKCLEWIVSKLNQQTSNISGSNMLYDGYIVVRIACPVDVSISDSNGSELNSSAENFMRVSSFGRLDIIGLSNDIKMACINDSPNFSIILNGTDIGTMDYDIRYFNGNDELYKEDSFRNIPITANTVIKTGTDSTKTTVLDIDNNGDGIIDYYLVPESSRGTVTITRQPESRNINAGEYAVFAVDASGNSLRYQWNINRRDGKGWTLIPGATNAEYMSGPASLSDDGNEYHCLITDGEGHTVSTKLATLHVYDSGDTDDDNNIPNEEGVGRSDGGGGCNMSGLWTSMMILSAGMIILVRKTVR